MSANEDHSITEDRETFLARFRERLEIFVPPSAGFNALAEPNENLVSLGLPPQPDQASDRKRWELWKRFFAPRVEYQTQMPVLSQFQLERHFRLASLSGSQRLENSHNWAGGYITPHRGRRFLEIYGIWQVPEVTTPTDVPVPASREYYSSAFIGLDGQRLYIDASLPQIGTRHNLDSLGNPIYETWFEWFERERFTWPTKLDVQVKPGDSVLCWITVTGPHRVRAMIRNLDTLAGKVVNALAPDIPAGSGLFRPWISGATAEWIMERPTGLTGIEVLTDYQQIDFEACLAVSGKPSVTNTLHDLTGARLIRMIDQAEGPHRSVLRSRPSLADPTSLSVNYI